MSERPANIPAEHWRRLGDTCHIEMGQSPPSTYVFEGLDDGLPFLQGNAEFGEPFPNPIFSCAAPAKIGKAGSVLISVRAPVGAVNLADRDYCIGRGLAAILPRRYPPTFIAAAVNKRSGELARVSQGTTFEAIGKRELHNLEVYSPEMPIAFKIAEVLDTLDAAIRGTEAVVAKLRALKQGLLHDLLTRGIDANGDLRPPQPEAPHLYHQTPLGWLPKEWGVTLLGDQLIGGPRNGFSPQDAGRETGVKMLGLGCLSEDGFEPRQLKNAPASVLTHPARLREGDILISRSNTMAMVGRVGIYRDVGYPCIYPDLMMRLVPSASYVPQFMELVLRSSGTRRQIQNSAVGTSGSMVKINSRSVRGFLIPKVSMSEQERILDTLMKLSTKLQREQTYLDKLRLQKSGLMDDLLTGRVPVTPLL